MGVWIWLALIAAPLLALTDQAIALALVGWACAHQTTLPLHASHTVFFALAVGTAAGAWLAWTRTATAARPEGDGVPQRHFLAGLAVAVGALSALAIAAMWVPTWMISACIT
jgi:hypothetical protein